MLLVPILACYCCDFYFMLFFVFVRSLFDEMEDDLFELSRLSKLEFRLSLAFMLFPYDFGYFYFVGLLDAV
jgi:hypothetical protein